MAAASTSRRHQLPLFRFSDVMRRENTATLPQADDTNVPADFIAA